MKSICAANWLKSNLTQNGDALETELEPIEHLYFYTFYSIPRNFPWDTEWMPDKN